MNEESKLIELFKKYPGIAARYGGHLLITTTKSNGKSNITLTFSKNQKLFTLSLKILSTFSNPLSNEN